MPESHVLYGIWIQTDCALVLEVCKCEAVLQDEKIKMLVVGCFGFYYVDLLRKERKIG